jgi:NitT/TauT family transport system ATP-binding protein
MYSIMGAQSRREAVSESSRDENHSHLSITNYTKEYGSGDESVLALSEIALQVAEGEFVSVVGPSGCGKSTLLHSISGILEPTEGTIEIDGTNVQSPDHAKHEVGLVFQDPVLLDWRTISDNVMLPVEILLGNDQIDGDEMTYRERTEELLELVGLEGFGDAYPNELSGGMQQRASICRSLVYDPSVLLMDEPFGALDALTRQKMNQELLDIWESTGKTVLFVTHNLEEAIFLSDRVVVLSDRPGQIRDVVDIDIDRPRTEKTRTNEQYHELVDHVYEYFY